MTGIMTARSSNTQQIVTGCVKVFLKEKVVIPEPKSGAFEFLSLLFLMHKECGVKTV